MCARHLRQEPEERLGGVGLGAVLSHCSTHSMFTCCVCGVAQWMFNSAGAFNQPLGAWDVGQVTNMQVRRRPHLALELERGWGSWLGGGSVLCHRTT